MTTAELSILSPVTLATFFESYWEQQPLYIERSAAAFSYLFDFCSFETLLGTQPLYFPGLQLTQSGKAIDAGSYRRPKNYSRPWHSCAEKSFAH